MKPVELKENVWWLANRSDSLLEVNVYLLGYLHEKGRLNVRKPSQGNFFYLSISLKFGYVIFIHARR
ncbi:MAG: hypothetical protein OEV64_04590 [Desulfobulbaceae bacterium]|nr:hypothetical protein [Desulfobulbaceae bacterium]